MQKIIGRLLSMLPLLAMVAAIALSGTAQAAQQSRIQSVDGDSVSTLKGTVHPFARQEFDQGLLDSATVLHGMTLSFRPTATQEASLDALLKAQQDPSSPLYHQWLTQQQFADRFGMSEADIAKVSQWLQAQGFSIDGVAASRNSIRFTGTVAVAEQAFHTRIHKYLMDGESHFANSTAIALPTGFSAAVFGVRGLDNFTPRAHVKVRTIQPDEVHANFTSGSSGLHFVAPGDFATIYNTKVLLTAGNNGQGVSIGVMGQTDIVMADVTSFRAASNLSANNPTVFLVPGSADPGTSYGDLPEADLDVEWSGAAAPGANIIYVNSTNVLGSLLYAIQNPVNGQTLPVLSISYGNCEPNFAATDIATFEAAFKQANSQGQTIMSAAGDSGAADCDYSGGSTPVTSATHGLRVDYPASSAYVTGLGGNSFNEGNNTHATPYWTDSGSSTTDVVSSAKSYIPEATWNDTSASISAGGGLSAGGGGTSFLFAKPYWQSGVVGIPNDAARDVPDVSLNASPNHDGYLYCTQYKPQGASTYSSSCTNNTFRFTDGSLQVVGGTSAGAPGFSGIVALINQKVGSKVGNINPTLYALASDPTTYGLVFHDVTIGDNGVPCSIGTADCPSGGIIGYQAGTGYDQVTGLGSVDATLLAAAFNRTATTLALSVTPTSPTISTTFTMTATITPAAATGTVNFSIDGGTAIAGTVTGGVATATASVATGGLHTISAAYVGTTTYLPSNNSAIFTFVPASSVTPTTTTVAASPATISLYGSTTLTATVASATGGIVNFTNGNALVGSAVVNSSGVATFLVNDATPRQGFAVGPNTITATYGGDATHGASSGTTVVTVVNPSFTVSVTDMTINSASAGNSGTSTITLKSVQGYAGTINLTASSTTLTANGSENPSAVTLTSGGTGTSVITITTVAGSLQKGPAANLRHTTQASRLVAGGGAALGCIFLLGIPGLRRKRWTVLSSLLLFGVLLGGIGCGGGGSSTPPTGGGTQPGTYTVTVTGTDSVNTSITASANFTVTVK